MTEEGLADWTGSCLLGKASGDGIASYKDNYIQTITGKMVAGVPTGVVRVDYSRGGYFVGTLKDGEAHGFGLNMEPWGEGYEGNWVDGFRHGDGTYIHSDGRRIPGVWRKGSGLVSSWYVDDKTGCNINLSPMNDPEGEASWAGECINEKAEGKGTVFWSISEDGAPRRRTITFTGELVKGVISGEGVWFDVDVFTNVTHTTTIKAVWKNGEINGQGQEVKISDFTNKSSMDKIVRSYEGGYEFGDFSGDGRLEEVKGYSDNSTFTLMQQGSFADNFFHGVGKEIREFTSSTGDKSYEEREGRFEKNNFVGHGRKFEKTTDGTIIKVTFDDDVNSGGTGTVAYANGDRFSGTVDDYGGPSKGYCDFPSASFKGDCRRNSINVSEGQGAFCLVAVNQLDECLLLISSWVE